jgi:hypothetical protein
LPLLTLSLLQVFSEDGKVRNRWIGVGGLSLAGLVLTHNITAYMFLPFYILLGILLLIFTAKKSLKLFASLISLGLLGALSSLYFWFPAIADSKLVKYDTVFNFVDHFPTLKQLIVPYWGYGASVPGPGDGLSFFIGSVNWLLFLSGTFQTIFFWKKFSELKKIFSIWLIIIFLTSFLMMNYRSIFLWNHLPFLPYFQFPWRFLIMTTFSTALLVLPLEHVKFNKQIALFVSFLVIALNFGFFHPHDFLGREDSYYINRYIPVPFASANYKNTGEEYLRLPVNTQIRPDQNYPIIYPPNEAISGLQILSTLSATFNTSSESLVDINYSKYYFPGWVVKVDDTQIAAKPGVPFGQINFQVPPGNHQILVAFQETTLKVVLDIISVLAILYAAFKIVFKR